VAELVRDHALQLIAVEAFERAACDRDGGVGRVETGGERVDAGLVLQHVDLGHRHAGGERHLLDDVVQAPLQRVLLEAGDALAAERHRHRAAAAAQAAQPPQRGQPDEGRVAIAVTTKPAGSTLALGSWPSGVMATEDHGQRQRHRQRHRPAAIANAPSSQRDCWRAAAWRPKKSMPRLRARASAALRS
jgi:hypothetical protein